MSSIRTVRLTDQQRSPANNLINLPLQQKEANSLYKTVEHGVLTTKSAIKTVKTITGMHACNVYVLELISCNNVLFALQRSCSDRKKDVTGK